MPSIIIELPTAMIYSAPMKTYLAVANVILGLVQLGLGLIGLAVFAGWLAIIAFAVFAEGWGAGLAVFLFGLPVIAVFSIMISGVLDVIFSGTR
jgi:hypothetical protein